jgi:hypothetical protein
MVANVHSTPSIRLERQVQDMIVGHDYMMGVPHRP